MTVVVTGAAGHIGGNLVRALLKQKRHVRAMVHTDTRALDGLDVELVEGDVRNPASLAIAFRGADTVFHLASRISISGGMKGKVDAINVQGAANVADACLATGVKRLVHFSSVHAYHHDNRIEPLDENRDFALGTSECAYDRSKAMGQLEVLARVDRGLDAVVLNPTGVIGYHDYKPSRMGRVFLDMASGRLPALVDGGFDWVDVRDVCDAALAAEVHGVRGLSYLVGGTYVTMTELHGMISELSGSNVPGFTCPQWLAKAVAPFAYAFSELVGKEPMFTSESLCALRSNKQISCDLAARDLGYNPRLIKQTLCDTYDWWVGQGELTSHHAATEKESAANA